MSKLCILAGRPGTGKTEYLNSLKSKSKGSFLIISATDYSSHEDLVRHLYDLVQDEDCKCIAIDNYEETLIKRWNGIVRDDEYRKVLSILAGFSDNYDISVYVVVGLKREADKNGTEYFSKENLRSAVITEVADSIEFVKNGHDVLCLKTMKAESSS